MIKSSRVIRLGDKGVYEKTDPDYNDKKFAQLARDYRSCPDGWKDTFLAGLSNKDVQELRKRGVKL